MCGWRKSDAGRGLSLFFLQESFGEVAVLHRRQHLPALGILGMFAALFCAAPGAAVTRTELAGNSRPGYPWFQPAQAFHESGSVEVGVDPS